MPVLTMAPSGSGLSSGGGGTHERVKRERCKGWTVGAAGRQRRFLMAVRSDLLDGQGLAVTLTMRDLPAGPEELHDALELFERYCRHRGMLRGHWVTEDQARGIPHFHLALYFPEMSAAAAAELGRDLVAKWCAIASCWGARPVAQHVDAIKSGAGWSKYCAKHASRSVRHYQREGLPAGWDHSGRLWGKWETEGNEWPTEELRLYVDAETFLELRRMLRAWRHADACKALRAAQASLRAARDDAWRRTAEHHVRVATGRVRSTKRPRQPAGDTLDAVRKVSGAMGMREWVPMAVMDQMLRFLELTAGNRPPVWKSGRLDRSATRHPWQRWHPDVHEWYDEPLYEIAA